MAHDEQGRFVRLVKRAFPQFFVESRVVDIGSLDVNGSAREHFKNGRYIGVDIVPGSGVDVVCQGQNYDAPDGSFDVVLSCEAMEHNPHWSETFKNMVRLCRPGGLIIMTCATSGRAEHGTPRSSGSTDSWAIDYYGNLEAKDFSNAMDLKASLSKWTFCTNVLCYDLYFVGFKKGSAPPENADAALAAIRLRYFTRNFYRFTERALRKLVTPRVLKDA